VIGATLDDRYRVEAELGRGGMGVIYRAHDLLLDRPVAVKVVNSVALAQLGNYEEGLRAAREAVELSRVAGDRRQEPIALRRTAIALAGLYRMAEALPQAEAGAASV
jgi:hypothetical protein